MKTKLKPALVGLFVLGACGLTVAGLLAFGSSHLFSKPGRFVAYFNESVQGLDLGSAVKLRGVRVGRVRAIRVRYEAGARQAQVAVVAELDQNVLSDRAGQMIKITDRVTLERLVAEGLRAKIDLVGITGLQFVQLDFLDPAQFPAPPEERASSYPVVPTVPSGMSALIGNISKIVTQLNKVDFAGLSLELKGLLATANRQVGDLDLKKLVAKVAAAAESIEALAGSAEAKAAFGNLNQTATDVRGLVAKLDTQVEPVRADLARTLHSFQEAAQSIHQLLGPASGLGEEAARTLRQVAETAEAIQGLADFLERNPNALITGKRRPTKAP